MTSTVSPATPASPPHPDTADARSTWEVYVEAWKVPGDHDKLDLVDRCLVQEVVYTDPEVTLTGRDSLLAHMRDFHRQVPGAYFVTRWFQAHHGQSVARWDMVAANGDRLGEGVSHARYAPDGRLTAMTGFFEPPAD